MACLERPTSQDSRQPKHWHLTAKVQIFQKSLTGDAKATSDLAALAGYWDMYYRLLQQSEYGNDQTCVFNICSQQTKEVLT